MSKQSRAKSRARRRARGTGAAAAMYVSNLNRMSDANAWFAKAALKDELHKILCDRRIFKDNKFIELFCSNLWGALEREIALHHSSSPKRLRALDLIVKIRML